MQTGLASPITTMSTDNGTHSAEYWAMHICNDFVPLLTHDNPAVYALVVAARHALYGTMLVAVARIRNAEAAGHVRATEDWLDGIVKAIVVKVQSLEGEKDDYDTLYDRAAARLRYWVNSICEVERRTRADKLGDK